MTVIAIVLIGSLSIILVHWMSLRERRLVREFERDLSSDLGKELQGLAAHLRERSKVQDQALAQTILQLRDVVGFSQDRRKEAETKAVAAGMQGRHRGQ